MYEKTCFQWYLLNLACFELSFIKYHIRHVLNKKDKHISGSSKSCHYDATTRTFEITSRKHCPVSLRRRLWVYLSFNTKLYFYWYLDENFLWSKYRAYSQVFGIIFEQIKKRCKFCEKATHVVWLRDTHVFMLYTD